MRKVILTEIETKKAFKIIRERRSKLLRFIPNTKEELKEMDELKEIESILDSNDITLEEDQILKVLLLVNEEYNETLKKLAMSFPVISRKIVKEEINTIISIKEKFKKCA